jgi:hypothetical protein
VEKPWTVWFQRLECSSPGPSLALSAPGVQWGYCSAGQKQRGQGKGRGTSTPQPAGNSTQHQGGDWGGWEEVQVLDVA